MFDLLGSLLKLVFYLIFFGGVLALLTYLFRQDKPLLAHAISHWHTSIPQLQGTPLEFYRAVQKLIEAQNMPGVVIKIVAWHEGGVFSEKRNYLRVRWGEFSYDVCVAPFGSTLFASSWLCLKPNNLLAFLITVPIVSWFAWLWIKLFDPETYYKIDSGLMFQGAVHACLLSVLDQMIAGQGAEPIPEFERKPVMRDLYGRRKQAA